MGENDESMELSTPKREFSKQKDYLSVVPWRNAVHFRKVYECLYSPSVNDKIWATDEITVWETRCHYALPAAIEATNVLGRAVIQDMLVEGANTLCRERDLQNLYAMAIVRFVNLTLEKESKEKNLSILADKYNIPRWVVELRHDATHAKMPSLPLLRMGVKMALRYLEEKYWKAEADNVCPIVKTLSNQEVCLALLRQFKSEQLKIFETNKDGKVAAEKEKNRTALIKKIRSFVMNNKEKFVEALVIPGVFLNEKEIKQFEEGEDNIYVNHSKALKFPETFIKFWLPIFKILHKCDLILTFLEMLLLSLEHIPSTMCHSTAAAVVIYFIRAALPEGPMSDLKLRFKAKGVLLDSNRLLYVSMMAANQSTGQVFDEIVKSYHGDSEDCSDLYLVVLPRQGMITSRDMQLANELKDEDTMVFTVDDLEKDINEVTTKINKKSMENKWSMAPLSMNFSEMPLGVIINPGGAREPSQAMSEEVEMEVQEFLINDDHPVEVEGHRPEENDNMFEEIGDMIYRR